MASIATTRDTDTDLSSSFAGSRRSSISLYTPSPSSSSSASAITACHSGVSRSLHHRSHYKKPHKANEAAWEAVSRLRRAAAGGKLRLEHFQLLRRLGSGDIGNVYLCQIRNPLVGLPPCLYAMKVVDKEAVAIRKKEERAAMEKEILSMMDHPFCPTLYAAFDASHYSCLLIDFCPGGDLYAARLRQPKSRFSLSSAKFYAAETLLALEYLHMMGIVYRDLKPENVLIREDGHIMLSDFDLSFKCDVVPKLLNRHGRDANANNDDDDDEDDDISPRCSTTPSCTSTPLHPVLSCLSSPSLRRKKILTVIRENALEKHSDAPTSARKSSNTSSGITRTVSARRRTKSETAKMLQRSTSAYSKSSRFFSDRDRKAPDIPKPVLQRSYSFYAGRAGVFSERELVAEPVSARSRSFVGTHEYLAPEVISGQGHGSAVDWWTFGVFLYEMLYGATPFKGENNEKTLINILKKPLSFPRVGVDSAEEYEEIVKAQDLIAKLLVKNPKRRIGYLKGSVEIKKHEFFKGVNWALIRSVKPPWVPSDSCRVKRNNQLIPPKLMSKKERDAPYEIPNHHHHHHHFEYF